jgi:hypothetical protein
MEVVKAKVKAKAKAKVKVKVKAKAKAKVKGCRSAPEHAQLTTSIGRTIEAPSPAVA